MNIFKKITIPSGETEVTALENWTVRWESRYGKYSDDTQSECEVFISEEEANQFAESLKKAFKLIKHTYGTNVIVKRTK